MKSWEIRATSDVMKTSEGKIEVRKFRESGNEHYHLQVRLDGPAERLDEIERVEYLLHPTFRQRTRESSDRASGFAIDFWTWGMFDIDITLHLKDGQKESMRYFLRYSLPADTGDNYAEV